MLLGQGRFAQQQTGYPLQVFEQVNQIAIRAWKSLPNRGEVSENLTLILTPQMDTQVIEVMVSLPRGIEIGRAHVLNSSHELASRMPSSA